MIVTVHDFGKVHGGINWSNPRYDDGTPTDLEDWTHEEHDALCQAVVDQVSAWPSRPESKTTYDFAVRLPKA